jgi:hypothetical protein
MGESGSEELSQTVRKPWAGIVTASERNKLVRNRVNAGGSKDVRKNAAAVLIILAYCSAVLSGCAEDERLSESQRVILKASSDRSVEAGNAAIAAMDECDKSIVPFADQAQHDLTLDARARIFQPCLGQGHLYRTVCIEALADEAEVLDVKHGTSNAAGIRVACTNAIVANQASDKAFHSANETFEQVLTPRVAPLAAPAPAPVFIYQRQPLPAPPVPTHTSCIDTGSGPSTA